MASKLEVEGDDYIDMEVSSFSHNFLCNSHSHSQPREFEFQMSSISEERSEALASPADELFYKGKLLPLHLPPRLQMVEKLLQNSTSPKQQRAFQSEEQDDIDDFFSTPLGVTANPTPIATTTNTPFESCHVSRELNPDEYGFELDSDCHVENQNKKSWAKKLLKKKSSIGSTLKASRAYLKSLFGKSGGCSYENYYAASTKVADEGSVSKAARDSLNKQVKTGKKVPFGQIQRTYKEKSRNEDGNYGSNNSNRHRRSFSVGLKLLSGNNKSSTPLTTSVSGSSVHLKRCSSANSERENSIQGAIAHCKKSQNVSDVFVPRISVCEDQDRAELCRG